MNEHLEEAVNELKRADHMIFVSLKYTRTVDVIKNILERLILCFDATFDYLIQHLKETKKIDEIPPARSKKIDVLKDHYRQNADFQEFLDFYLMLRKINKAEFTRRQEFRRHVTMSAILEDKRIVELNIDVIHEYYLKTKSFVDFAVAIIAPSE
jgi:hypothetical protein